MPAENLHNGNWRRWMAVLLSPYVISLLVTGLLILLFFPKVSKYTVNLNHSDNFGYLALYADVLHDGESDMIELGQETEKHFSLVVHEKPSGLVNQWNLNGKILDHTNDCLITGDFDNDQKQEIYVFSVRNDSIMMHCIRDIRNNKPAVTDVFIAKFGKGKWVSTTSVIKAEMDDLNEDGYKELIFGLTAGYEITPRNIFAYDLRNRKLLASPFIGMAFQKIIQQDITGDGKNEILLRGYGGDNMTDTIAAYHDRSAWLMVLDRKLQFLFKPVEFKGAYSEIIPFVFDNGKKQKQAGFYIRSTADSLSELCYFSKNGNIIRRKHLPGIPVRGIAESYGFRYHGKPMLALQVAQSNVKIVADQEFNIRTIESPFMILNSKLLDIDNDGHKELISVSMAQNKLVIFRTDMSNPVSASVPPGGSDFVLISLKLNGKANPELVLWDHKYLHYFSYEINPLFYTRWLIFFGIYLGFLLFTWLIRRIQRYQIEQRALTEKKITELQMKLVKNQLDPHFTLNAVNSIIYAVGNNEPERATEHLYQFSNLYRHLLLTADQYKCTLKDELAFTENYLKMEQLRFRDRFSYTVNLGPAVDTAVEVPKMCIQTAAENAVKHGISQMQTGGLITIDISADNSQLVIAVSDNGIGREAAGSVLQTSTRKGVKLTGQYFELYSRITGRRVTSETIDLADASGTAAGTRVIITIQTN